MTTNRNINVVVGSTSIAKAIGGSDTTQPGAGVGESKLLLHSTREQEIRRRAYEIHLERGGLPGRELEDWLQAESELKSAALFMRATAGEKHRP